MIHQHTLEAYSKAAEVLGKRAREVYMCLADNGDLTDRQIRDLLFPGQDMNLVRPRITDLKRDGWIEETADTTIDAVSHQKVRILRAVDPETRRQRKLAQAELNLAPDSPTTPTVAETERCEVCSAELSQCGAPGVDGEPSLDCKECQLRATIEVMRTALRAAKVSVELNDRDAGQEVLLKIEHALRY